MKKIHIPWAAWALILLIYAGFVSLGLPDAVLGVAWPSMSRDFGTQLSAAGLLTLVITSGSLISSFSSGAILRVLHPGVILTLSCFLTGGALLGYGLVPSFFWIVLLTFPLGLGSGAVDAALNNYVAHHGSARLMNWLHCCWGLGATASPLIVTWVLAGGHSWRMGYWLIGGFQLFLAVIFWVALQLWRQTASRREKYAQVPSIETSSPNVFLLKRRTTVLSLLTYLIYGGVESSVGLWAYTLMTICRGVEMQSAGIWVGVYWGSLTGGRFLMGILSARFSNRTLVYLGIGTALIGAILFAVPFSPPLMFAGLMLMGFGFAPIYPCQMHETPRRFSKADADRVIGYQVAMGSLGFSVIPALIGWLAGTLSFEIIPIWIILGLLLLWVVFHTLNRLTPLAVDGK